MQLAAVTALDMDQVAPDTPSRLVHAAIHGDPLPESLLAACLNRLRAEGSDGFRPARLALIKLALLRRNIHVTDTLQSGDRHPAYVCGRLLSLFEQVQYAALGDVNANVTDKFFGTFSSAPGMVLARLFANSQNHLRKLRSEKSGAFVNLDRLLTEVSGLLTAPPKGQLSLHDQGEAVRRSRRTQSGEGFPGGHRRRASRRDGMRLENRYARREPHLSVVAALLVGGTQVQARRASEWRTRPRPLEPLACASCLYSRDRTWGADAARARAITRPAASARECSCVRGGGRRESPRPT